MVHSSQMAMSLSIRSMSASRKAYFNTIFRIAEKFPHLPHIQEAIRTACSVFEAARISIENDHVVRHSWNLMQDRIMESVLRQMVAQHRVVATTLLDTGNDLIIFDRADDGYWGTGANGLGQNKLGRLWMKVRADLLAAGIDRFSPMPKVSKAALGLPLD
jgi:predicted NAD-dependent protein-ADP-ribosyltransferase YbiA (DUF1768 family)